VAYYAIMAVVKVIVSVSTITVSVS